MSKANLTRQHSAGWETLSIEGMALHFRPGGGVELFVSSEKTSVILIRWPIT